MPVASSLLPRTIEEQKDALRTRMREERARLEPVVREAFGRDAASHLLGSGTVVGLDVRKAAQTVVAAYWPVGTEADCKGLLQALAGQSFVCVLPVVAAPGLPLGFREWRDGDTLLAGPLGTRQPSVSAPEHEPDVLIVPLLAFDRRGRRLGQGGGYYDRTLKALRQRRCIIAVGFALALQELPEVPATADDERLDWVATEKELMRCVA